MSERIHHRPSVTLKLATSLDGRIALANGQSRWITGDKAREQVHLLRAQHEAVIAGSETILADDPELTARTDPMPANQPVRIIADNRARTPLSARVLATLGMGAVAIATLETGGPNPWASVEGLQVWRLPQSDSGRFSLAALLGAAHSAGIRSLLVEGGGQLAASFVREGLVDRIEWFRAPLLLGAEGRPCIGPLGLSALDRAPHFTRLSVRETGPDLWETYVRT